jgi:hypothetical protein
MRWPWVSRKKYDELKLARLIEQTKHLNLVADLRETNRELESRVTWLAELERQERWKRMKLEGLVKFKDERIRKAIGLFDAFADGKKS